MKQIVVDASTVLAWLFEEGETATAIQPILSAHELVAPWLWRCEVINAVLVRERRKIITEAEGVRLLTLIDALAIKLEPPVQSSTTLAQIARPYQLTSYDAEYLDLALRLGLRLFTRDGNLKAAAKRAGIKLL